MTAAVRRITVALVLLLSATSVFAWGRSAPPDWVRALAKAPLPKYPDGTSAVVLLDETNITVAPNGEITRHHREASKILTTEARERAYTAVHFDDQSKLRDFRAWAITATGEEYGINSGDAVEASAYEGSLYSDFKVKAFRIPAAEPGSIIAVEWERRERPFLLQSQWDFQDEQPVNRSAFSITLPEGWKHEEKWFNAPAVQPTVTGATTTWVVSDQKAIKEEPSMPSWRAVAGRMAVNLIPPNAAAAHRTWADVGRWYNGLAASRRTATPELQAKVRELAPPTAPLLDRIRALAAFAQRDVRYVAIEIGIGGYQPHMAGEIFSNRFGDCKDKVTVLSTMLREAGIESYYLLVHTSRDMVDAEFPTAASFNHVIIAIPLPKDVAPKPSYSVIEHPKLGRLLLFDPTSTGTPVGYLPVYLQQSHGLLVTNDGGELLDLPVHPPEANQLTITARMKMDAYGTIDGNVAETRTGWLAAGMRETLANLSESARMAYVEKRLARNVSQHALKNLTVENLEDPSKELVVRYQFSAAGYARKTAGLVLVRPRVVGYAAEVVSPKDRLFAYEAEGPFVEVDDIAIAMPEGLSVDELPAPQNLTSAALTYASDSKFDANTLTYKRKLKMQAFRVPLAGIAELSKVQAAISADERSSAVLK